MQHCNLNDSQAPEWQQDQRGAALERRRNSVEGFGRLGVQSLQCRGDDRPALSCDTAGEAGDPWVRGRR